MTTPVPTQADRPVADADKDRAADIAHALGLSSEQFTSGAADILVQHLRDHRLTAERETREACARIAETAWVSADYDVVGIADADMAMALCEHTAAAIRNTENTDG